MRHLARKTRDANEPINVRRGENNPLCDILRLREADNPTHAEQYYGVSERVLKSTTCASIPILAVRSRMPWSGNTTAPAPVP